MRRFVVLLVFVVSACGAGPSPTSATVRQVIERQNATVVHGYASGDITSVASVFAEDAWQMPPNSPPLAGREAIAGFWRQAVQWGRWEFTLNTQHVDVSGPMAVERGKYVLTFTAGPAAPSGMLSFEDRGNYLVQWRHETDGQWRIVADAPVSELPLHPQANN